MKQQDWFAKLVGLDALTEGAQFERFGQDFIVEDSILRSRKLHTDTQGQTEKTFGYKWTKRDSYEGELTNVFGNWLAEKYGDVVTPEWLASHGSAPVLLDAGCGAGLSSLAVFGSHFSDLKYIGADISIAVDVARDNIRERKVDSEFIQCDLQSIPLPAECVDIIFSEGVLHHCDDTERAFMSVQRHLKPGGSFLFYVYKKKGPIREFTDDYIRESIKDHDADSAWDALMPLTELGKMLGELDIEIDVPKNIDLLEIPAGKINLQRLFYWHVFKAFYRPEMNLDEMNHINFDWYAPANAHRHTIDEIRQWCGNASMTIEYERVEEAGITIAARKNLAPSTMS
jgi:SAM-dependent methyltransferase